jgi:hypothetical protein
MPNLDDPDYLWGCAAIAAVIERNKRQTFHLLESGSLPARKVGATWVAKRAELRDLSCWPQQPAAPRKPAASPAEKIRKKIAKLEAMQAEMVAADTNKSEDAVVA